MNDVERADTLLKYAKTAPFASFENGYQSLLVGEHIFTAQRDCVERLSPVRDMFKDKFVVDFGCNIGGMLHVVSSEIAGGIGFDKNVKCVNVANALSCMCSSNLRFFTFNLDSDPIEIIRACICQPVDICMLLSIAKWVKRWRELVSLSYELCDTILFETNGDDQQSQIEHMRSLGDVEIVRDSSLDDPGQHRRKLLLCRRGTV